MSLNLALVSDRPWPNKQTSITIFEQNKNHSFNSNDFSKLLLNIFFYSLILWKDCEDEQVNYI